MISHASHHQASFFSPSERWILRAILGKGQSHEPRLLRQMWRMKRSPADGEGPSVPGQSISGTLAQQLV